MESLILSMTKACLIGLGATLFMDIWALFLQKFFKLQPLNYRIVGRWLRYCANGQFAHATIFQKEEQPNEVVIGWVAHYATGVIFAMIFVMAFGPTWLQAPSILPAALFGLITVVFPFFIMQPAFGVGFAASKTPTPNWMRFKSTQAHLSFGIGLFISAWILTQITL